jgi:hypothetical protein
MNRQDFIIPQVSRKAFWDVSFEKIDFEKSSLFVMQKIFNYGTWADQVALLKYYGPDRIRREIVHASYLREPVMSFLSTILDLQKNDFECYIKAQSNPLRWPY